MSGQPYRFVFVIGASGSGTSMLSRLLGAPPGCVCLGGSDVSIPKRERSAYRIAKRFQRANDHAWNRWRAADRAEEGRRRMLELIERLLRMPGYTDVSSVIFKRSAPFHRGDRYRPDLRDIERMFDDHRIVVIYRDARASTASSHRRKFADNLRACAVITEEQLTCLAAQLATLPEESYATFQYEDFCRDPDDYVGRIATFLGMDVDPLLDAVRKERVSSDRVDAWRTRLTEDEVAFLDDYFDERRCSQWARLSRTHFPAADPAG